MYEFLYARDNEEKWDAKYVSDKYDKSRGWSMAVDNDDDDDQSK